MEANKIKLLEFLGTTKKTFNIPVYQRNYDWKEEHCTRLFRDIENIAKSNYEQEHFIGTVVYVLSYVQPTYQELVLIDGQQRITSITLLIKALYDTIQDEDVKEDILETYLINKRAPENLRVKLKPIESDAVSYRNIIENQGVLENSNIGKNYNLFKALLANSKFTAENIYNALNNIELVYIQLEKDKKSENPQMIFESPNSTGLSLTQGDLIRNFLLMNHSYDEQTRLYKEYWLKIEKLLTNSEISDFVRDYLTMKKGNIPNKDKVYIVFKDFASDPELNMDEEGILEDLLMYAEYYSWFLLCNSPYETLNKELSQLQQLKSTTVYPAILYIFEDCFEYQKIQLQELEKILKLIVSYLFRRVICGYPTHSLNKIFAGFVNAFEKSNKTSDYDKILEILMSKSSSGTFPRDEEFRNEFIKKDLYKTKIDKYTLYQIEKYKSKEIIELSDDITIEHIMPQKLNPTWQIALGNKYEEIHTEYLHTIGNLTLTGYNSNLSNKNFIDKKEIFKDSNIFLSRSIRDYDLWNKESIINRAKDLFDIAKEIWFIPEEYNKVSNNDITNYSIDYNIMDDINVTGEKPRQLIVADMEYNVNSWKDVFRRLADLLFEIDKNTFEKFLKHSDFKGREKRIVSNTDDGMNSPYMVADGVYLETNLNANAIINYCRLMAEHYELQEDISIMLRA